LVSDRPGPVRGSPSDQAGKLAVVLGIEVDHLFESYPDRALTADQLRAAIARYHDLGVRYVFPIHVNNNLFGGTAFQSGLQLDPQYPGNGPINPVGTLPASAVPTIPDTSLGYHHGRQMV
jgi:hypothetical protein